MQIQAPFLIFDIGSNVGSFADRHKSTHSIVCVEPNPNLVDKLKEKYKTCKNVFVENVAVSNEAGMVSLDICPEDQMSSCNPDWLRTLRYSKVGITKTISVPCVTIDHLIEKYGKPKHIKVDVEGYEYNALCGLTKNVCPLQFEFIGESFKELTIPVINRMHEIGYSKFSIKVLCGDFDVNEYDINTYEFFTKEKLIDLCLCKNLNGMGGMILGI